MQWFLTRYARLTRGQYELLSYQTMPSLEVAQVRAKTQLPNNEFYHIECCVGSLLELPDTTWVARERYSHKPQVALQQVEAELCAIRILNRIKTNRIDLKNTFAQIKDIRPFLTTPQFEVLFSALKSNPKVIQMLYKQGGAI
jgi:hypothetical protein